VADRGCSRDAGQPFAAKFIVPENTFPYIAPQARIATALVAVFGLLLCAYAYTALRDVRDHIESNWRKAGYLLKGTWQAEWGGRKSHGWSILQVVGVLAVAGFLGLLALAAFG
jgi:hypothetical protein